MFRYDPFWTEIEFFRPLYDTLVALKPDAVPDCLRGRGVEAARPLMRALEPYKRRNSASNPYEVQDGDLWDLYGLSRISDHLLLPFQIFDSSYLGPHTWHTLTELLPPIELVPPESGRMSAAELFRILDAPWPQPTAQEYFDCIPQLSSQDYLSFFEALGFERHRERTFSPFYHELVEVEETAGDSTAVEIVQEY